MGPMSILAVVVLILWTTAFLFLWRIPTCEKAASAAEYPTLSVIIPARNEERNLPRLLASLADQDLRPLEVIVVDDGSTDDTAAKAKAAGAVVLESKPLPDGWRGKTWACMQGAERAEGEALLFVDADVFFEPQHGLRRVMNAFAAGRGALSVGPYHRVERWYEELSAVFNLLMTAGTGAFTIWGENKPPAGLFGPFLMVDTSAYVESGGHEAVKGRILENFHLARIFADRGVQARCLGGKGAVNMRMYPDGLAGLIEGWSKAFASGAGETPRWILLASIAWLTGALIAVIELIAAFATGRAGLILIGAALYTLFAAQFWNFLRRIGSFRLLTAALYPIPLVFYQIVFARSLMLKASGKKVSWKGRQIDAD